MEEKDFHEFVKEKADFFDSVDTQELEWEDAGVKFKRPEMAHISIRIPKEGLAVIKKKARQ